MSCDKYECNTEYAIKMKHCNRIAILQLENPLFKGILGDILPATSTNGVGFPTYSFIMLKSPKLA